MLRSDKPVLSPHHNQVQLTCHDNRDLNTVDKSLLIQMVLNQQEQLETLTAEVRSLNRKMQLMMEQMVLANRN